MAWLEPVILRGAHARLEPLSQDHHEGLAEAVQDGELWKLWYTFVPRPEDMRKEIDRRLGLQAAGSMLPWTVFDAGGKIAGREKCRGHFVLRRIPGVNRVDAQAVVGGQLARDSPLILSVEEEALLPLLCIRELRLGALISGRIAYEEGRESNPRRRRPRHWIEHPRCPLLCKVEVA